MSEVLMLSLCVLFSLSAPTATRATVVVPDESGNGLDATFDDSPQFVSECAGQALEVFPDPVGNYYGSVGATASQVLQALTVEGFFRWSGNTDGESAGRTIIDKVSQSSDDGRSWAIGIIKDTRQLTAVVWYSPTNGRIDLVDPDPLPNPMTQCVHVALTVSAGGEVRLYRNGQLKDSESFAGKSINYASNTPIGFANSVNYSSPMVGVLDQFRISDTVRTSFPSGPQSLSLDANTVALWRFGVDCGPPYTVSGYVRDAQGDGIPGVQVHKGCDGGSYTTTDLNGYWEIGAIAEETCTFTPASSGCVFSPPNQIVSGCAEDVDFTCNEPPASACYPLTADPGVFTFVDQNNYLHGAFPAASHTVVDGDGMGFDMRITGCSVPGSLGAESAIGFTTQDNAYSMGILLVYDDQACYRVRLFANGSQGSDAILNVGTTYHYAFDYSGGTLSLAITDAGGSLVHSDAMAHSPGTGDIFQFGVDYPGGGTEYFQWANRRVKFRVDRAADPSHIEGWVDNVNTPGCNTPMPPACHALDEADPGVFTFVDQNNYLHGAFPVASHTVVDGDGMGFDMRITDCSVPGSFGAESAIGFTTQDSAYSMGILLVYDDQVCYRVRLFANGVPGADATLNVGTTYHYAFDYSGGTLSLAITDAGGSLVHSDAMAHSPGTGDIFQFGVDYPGGGTEYFQWAAGRVEFRVDRAADLSHIEGWIDNVNTPGCEVPACNALDENPGVFTFPDQNGYVHGALRANDEHTVVDGDRMGFDMEITGCSVPGSFGAESAIGFTTTDNSYSMGILLVYDDQVCYRVRLFANGFQGADVALNVGTTYRYAFGYSGGTLSLAIADAGGSLVHSDIMAHVPGSGNIFQFGVDYPGGGTEYFRWANERVEFRVDREADPSHIEGWIDNISTPGCDHSLTAVPETPVSLIPRLWAAPNPLASTTELSFELPTAERAQLAIFDVSGRLVRTIVDATLVAGLHRFQWNGLTASGRSVAAGVYFGRVTTAHGAKSTRLVVLR